MQQPITITDNSQRLLTEQEMGHLDNLKRIAERPIAKLRLNDNPNLLIFPRSLKEHGDGIGDSHILQLAGGNLVTGNIMGFIGYHDTRVRIKSRFAQDDGNDFFLHYMLQKVFAINLFDLKYNSEEESIFDFLIYLFPSFLKRALRQGLYKEYQTRRYNDANIRGRIDVNRHIQKNIPFAGNIAYSTREYVYDNHVSQLIRHTIEYIARHPYSSGMLQNDEATKEAVSQIKDATPTYNRNERRRVIGQNLRPLSHPYFYEYCNLQRLCLQILRHEEIKYGLDDDEVYGILFDGAWLWEEYLNTFLADIGFEHPRNKEGKGRKYLFLGNTSSCYPDFVREDVVLDAKYKWYDDWDKLQKSDLYQIISYMHVLDKDYGGFIVPVDWGGKRIPSRMLKGKGGLVSVYGMNICDKAQTFEEYKSQMVTSEQELIRLLSYIKANPI